MVNLATDGFTALPDEQNSIEDSKALDLLVSGKVQGVGFRRLCAEQAWQIGAAGWVRNLSNGKVEVHIEGSANQIDQLVAWCHEGPRWGFVDSVIITPGVYYALSDFIIR